MALTFVVSLATIKEISNIGVSNLGVSNIGASNIGVSKIHYTESSHGGILSSGSRF